MTCKVDGCPETKRLVHLCRTPLCVNPAHLEPVTQAENMRRGANARKTHCPQGHPYDEANTIIRHAQYPSRSCRVCARQQARDGYRRKRLATFQGRRISAREYDELLG